MNLNTLQNGNYTFNSEFYNREDEILELQVQIEKILECIINMANAIDIEVIAEGVETDQQAKMLERLGCYLVQGYRYGKPMPESKFKSKIRGN